MPMSRKAYYCGYSCGNRRSLRYGAVLCGSKNNRFAVWRRIYVFSICSVAYYALAGFILRRLLYNGALGIS